MNELIKLWISVTKEKEIEEFESDVQKLYDYTMNLQKENEQLKERIEYLERSNNRREDTILEQREEIGNLEQQCKKQKEVIDKVIECVEKEYYSKNTVDIESMGITTNKLLQVRNLLKEVSE